MKKSASIYSFMFVALAALPAIAFVTAGTKDVFKVDVSQSEVKWLGKKVTGKHIGTVKLKEGSLVFEDNKLIGGEFVADMSTIENEDVQDPDSKQKLVGHLKSDDFFSVEKNPTAQFVIKQVTPKSEGEYDVSGDLTIRGKTNPVTFPVTITSAGDKYTAQGKIKVDRTKYDIKFRSKSFFDVKALGDNMISDDFELDLTIVANK